MISAGTLFSGFGFGFAFSFRVGFSFGFGFLLVWVSFLFLFWFWFWSFVYFICSANHFADLLARTWTFLALPTST
jgi:hypothetical protein